VILSSYRSNFGLLQTTPISRAIQRIGEMSIERVRQIVVELGESATAADVVRVVVK
jgi:hypothetical protein